MCGSGGESGVTNSTCQSHNYVKNLKPKFIVLFILLFASTFLGVPINGGDKGWFFAFSNEMIVFGNTSEINLRTLILVWILVVTHLSLFALPFIKKNKHFFKLLVAIPLLYLLLQVAIFYFILILLVPFIIVWVITLVAWKNDND